jgi:hypothetical protein
MIPNGGSGVVGRVGGFVAAVTKDVVAEEEEEDDGGESTIESMSIGVSQGNSCSTRWCG